MSSPPESLANWVDLARNLLTITATIVGLIWGAFWFLRRRRARFRIRFKTLDAIFIGHQASDKHGEIWILQLTQTIECASEAPGWIDELQFEIRGIGSESKISVFQPSEPPPALEGRRVDFPDLVWPRDHWIRPLERKPVQLFEGDAFTCRYPCCIPTQYSFILIRSVVTVNGARVHHEVAVACPLSVDTPKSLLAPDDDPRQLKFSFNGELFGRRSA